MSISASTKLYGFFTPSRKIFGDKIQTIRHVIKQGSGGVGGLHGTGQNGVGFYPRQPDAHQRHGQQNHQRHQNGAENIPELSDGRIHAFLSLFFLREGALPLFRLIVHHE